MSYKKILIPIYNRLIGLKIKDKGNDNSIDIKALSKKSSVKISGNNNQVILKDGTKIENVQIIISGDNHCILIEENCSIKNTDLWIEDNDNFISIGSNTTIEEAHIASTEPHSSIEIGQDCMLSSGIDIRNGDSHSILNVANGERINYADDIKIGDHVWVGYNAQILKGVQIDENSIISAKAVVTKNVPSNSIAAGVPAKVIKKNIDWERKRIYK